jgi:hypothetical protein
MDMPNWFHVSVERAKPGSPITAVTRTLNHLDLFATDEGSGAVYSTPLPYEWELFPPQRPTGLHVTEVGDRKIGVAWKDRSDNEGGSSSVSAGNGLSSETIRDRDLLAGTRKLLL